MTVSPLTISSPAGGSFSPGDDLAGVHTDAEADRGGVASLDVRSERGERVANGEGRSHRPLGVVVVRERDAEDREHGIADELLAEPSEPLDLGVDQLEQLPLDHPELLGIDPRAQGRRAGEVREEDGDDPPLLVLRDGHAPPAARLERRAAGGAERGIGRRLGPAGRADPDERCATDAAKAVGRGLVGAAGRARHVRGHGISTVPSGADVDALLQQALADEILERGPRTGLHVDHAVNLPLGQQRRVSGAGGLPVGHLRKTSKLAGQRRAVRNGALEPLLADRHVEARLTERRRQRAERVPDQRLRRDPAPARLDVPDRRRPADLLPELA